MTEIIFKCEGIYHNGNKCEHGCIAIISSKVYPPRNCLLFVEGYGFTKPKWNEIKETLNTINSV
jgi:hypothetical protein